MTIIFGDLLYKEVEYYVDDLVVNTIKREDYLQSLRIVFECLQKHQLKKNLLRYAFGVSFGKFLGFIRQIL